MKFNKTKKCISGVLSLCTAVCLCVGGTFFAPTTTTAKAEALTLDSSLIKSSAGVTATYETRTVTSDSTATSKTGVYYCNKSTDVNKVGLYGGSYSGLTVGSDGTYESGFDGYFEGDTTLTYKFTGTSTTSANDVAYYGGNKAVYFNIYDSSNNFAFNMGDSKGDFYFKITSKADPSQTFTYKMVGEFDKYVGHSSSTVAAMGAGFQYVEYHDGTNWLVSCFNDKKAGNYFKTNVSTSNLPASNTYAPGLFSYFNGDMVRNTLTTKFYKNTSGYWALKVNYINRSSARAWFTNSADIAVCDGSNLPLWDFSEGYTIEFGSNYATGTDICFTSINANYTANPTESYSAKFVGLDGVELDTTCAAGETVTLPEGTNYNGETFVGWNIGGELYPAGYSWTVPADLTEDMTVNAVGVAFGIVDGASVRKVTTDNGKGGLRFTGHIATADAVANVAYGTYLNGVQVSATKVLTPTSAEGLMKEDYVADNTYFTAVITDLDSADYETDVTAETYIIVTYADGSTKEFKSVSVTRNAKQVAERALDEGETGDMLYEYAGRAKPVENN